MTIANLIDVLHKAAVEQGIDVSPRDVAWICAAFLEGMFPNGATPEVQKVIDALDLVTDE